MTIYFFQKNWKQIFKSITPHPRFSNGCSLIIANEHWCTFGDWWSIAIMPLPITFNRLAVYGSEQYNNDVYCFLFSSPGTEIHVSHCHHIGSVVVCHNFFKKYSPLKLLNRIKWNLAWLFPRASAQNSSCDFWSVKNMAAVAKNITSGQTVVCRK